MTLASLSAGGIKEAQSAKAIDTLVKSLTSYDLAVPIYILIAQRRVQTLNNVEERDLKLTSDLFDKVRFAFLLQRAQSELGTRDLVALWKLYK